MNTTTDADEQARFTDLFRATAHRVRAYASRHVSGDDVDEVLAETYLVAWRRRDRIDDDDPVPWLLVAARNIIHNQRRRARHREFSHPDLEAVAATAPSADGPVIGRSVALAALAALTPLEREAVLLVAWDGLQPRAAALVAGCTVRAFTVRLHRARARLTREFEQRADDAHDDATPAAATDAARRLRLPLAVKELS